MIPGIKKQYDRTNKMTTNNELNDLIHELGAALQETRNTLSACQEQNQRLVEGYKFYANRDNWRSRFVHLDNGERAREILKREIGYVK